MHFQRKVLQLYTSLRLCNIILSLLELQDVAKHGMWLYWCPCIWHVVLHAQIVTKQDTKLIALHYSKARQAVWDKITNLHVNLTTLT